MKSQLLVILLLLIFADNSFGVYSRPNKWGVNISYYGESAYHPGFLIGAEYKIWNKYKSREKIKGSKTKVRTRNHNFIVGGGLGLYNHPQNRKMLFIEPAIAYRYITPRRFKIDLEIGLGYMRSFYNAETIALTSNGDFETINAAGRSKFKPSAAIYIGGDYSNTGCTRRIPFSWQIGFPIYLEVPYNHTSIITTALEVGMTFFIPKRWKNDE